MIEKKYIRIIFISLVVIGSINIFDENITSENLRQYIQFIIIGFAILVSLPYWSKNNEGFALPVKIIFITMIVSIFMAYHSWHQGWIETVKATVPYMLWIFFFYLLHAKIPIETIEKIVVFYGILYLAFYYFQFVNYQTVYFGYADEYNDISRGVLRIIFPGGGVFFLTVFIALNKLTTQKEHRWFWLLFVILGIVVPILQATRQYIMGVALIYLFHFTKNLKWYRIASISAAIVAALLFVDVSELPIVKELVDEQIYTSQKGMEYIRVLSGQYFLTDLSPNIESQILGNGASYGSSQYGQFILALRSEKFFFLDDLGLIAVYAMFGIFAVIGIVMIWIKSISIPLPETHYYLKYYLWFLLILCLTSSTVYRYDFLITTVFTIYCYQVIYENKKIIVLRNDNTEKPRHLLSSLKAI
jgi:hypothetical protein